VGIIPMKPTAVHVCFQFTKLCR